MKPVLHPKVYTHLGRGGREERKGRGRKSGGKEREGDEGGWEREGGWWGDGKGRER